MSSSRGRGRPRIVVGYDGSETARAAVDWAARRAGRSGKVYVVHCTPPTPPAPGETHGMAVLDALLLEGGDSLLDVDYELELVDGGAAEGIARAASEHDADEIVVGSHGFGRLRAALGSVSHDVLHTAERPVMVIPTGALRPRAGSAT